MSQRDDAVPIRHMLEHAKEALSLVSGRSREELHAEGRVSPETQSRFPTVPWREAIATRHRIIHGYYLVDCDILWDTVQDDLPPLVAALEGVLADLG
jgi:uncharacterized protein with HEPN domain